MNKPPLSEMVYKAVSESLENMVFMETNRAEQSSLQHFQDGAYWARISILAPCSGAVTLWCPSVLAQEITESLFGGVQVTDPNKSPVSDALAEILNTISGRLMDSMVPENESFRLGLPETGQGAPPSEQGNSKAEWYTINDKHFCITIAGELLQIGKDGNA